MNDDVPALLSRIAVLESRLNSIKEATVLQAIEYERRLGELNHAQRLISTERSHFVSSEMFYAKIDELEKWRRQIDQFRWMWFGSGIAGGGITAALVHFAGAG